MYVKKYPLAYRKKFFFIILQSSFQSHPVGDEIVFRNPEGLLANGHLQGGHQRHLDVKGTL